MLTNSRCCLAERRRPKQSAPDLARDGLDLVLASIQRHVKKHIAITVTEAKEWLRTFGVEGKAAASKISKLSRIGNTQSHPIALQLTATIQQLVDLRDKNMLPEKPVAIDSTMPAVAADCSSPIIPLSIRRPWHVHALQAELVRAKSIQVIRSTNAHSR